MKSHLCARPGQVTKTYRAWLALRDRCSNPNYHSYHKYGGRGIYCCESWNRFENFLLDMGEAPAGYSLDRIDNDGPYCPSNCRWIPINDNRARAKSLFSSSTSGITGVSQRRDSGKWVAYYSHKGRTIKLGQHDNFFEAVCARKSWEAQNIPKGE